MPRKSQADPPHYEGAACAALDRTTLGLYRRRYAALVAEGQAAERAHSPRPTRAGPTKCKPLKCTPAGRLLVRLRRHAAWVLGFLEGFAVPVDSKAVEQDLRMMKLGPKVSDGLRTPLGALTFCALPSYVVTARQQC